MSTPQTLVAATALAAALSPTVGGAARLQEGEPFPDLVLPSMTRSPGGCVPASRAKVGKRSMVAATWSVVRPAGIFPGQRMIVGTRMPPS